jgi:hypothetical protein
MVDVGTRALTRRFAVAAVLAGVMAACGGGDDDDAGGGVNPIDAAGGEAVTDTAGGGAGAGGDGGGGNGGFSCAITAEQVGEVLGTAVEKDEATCGFAPGGNVGSVPGAVFLSQSPELCDEGFANQLGYNERVADMFGAEAYVQTSGVADAQVLVCSDVAFEVYVDDAEEGSGSAEASAETLALIALDEE